MRHFPLLFLGLLLLMALGDGYLNQPLPWLLQTNDATYFPFFTQHDTFPPLKMPFYKVEWREVEAKTKLHSPCSYKPSQSETQSFHSPLGTQTFQDTKGKQQNLPLRYRHWLGTDENGQDVLSGIIHGANISLKISLLSIVLLMIIGIYMGTIAGYYGDEQLKYSLWQLLFATISLGLGFFYGFYVPIYALQTLFSEHSLLGLLLIFAIFIGIGLVTYSGMKLAKRLFPQAKTYSFPLDSLILKLIETKNALPALLWIMIAGMYLKGFYALVGIIVFIGWTGIAQFTRLEVMKLRAQTFVEAAQALGLTEIRIITHHILRNALTPVISILLLSVSTIILLESSLAFLNIGVTAGEATWGGLLEQARRNNIDKWWLILFPTLMISLTVISLYQLAKRKKSG
ncbi:MAG: ABC transporter permease [Bacteroidia bacterium]